MPPMVKYIEDGGNAYLNKIRGLKTMKIYMAAIDNKYGTFIYAAKSEDELENKLAAYVADNWESWRDEDGLRFADFAHKADAIEYYFQEMAGQALGDGEWIRLR